jgi:hypothetical protein
LPTWALYLDESGNTERHQQPLKQNQTPLFTLAGTALPLEHWRDYDRAYLGLKIEFFQSEIDNSSKLAPHWEFKGNRAIAPRNADSDRIKHFCYRALDLIERFGGRLFSVSFLKNSESPTPASTMYTLALQLLAESFDIYLRERSDAAKGIIILDSRTAHTKKGGGLDYTVAQSYLSYMFGNEQGRQLKRLREAPLFADSGLTPGIQLADIVAALLYGNTYCHHLAPRGSDAEKGFLDYGHTRRYWSQIRGLRFQSANRYEGYQKFGLRVFDHRTDSGSTAG